MTDSMMVGATETETIYFIRSGETGPIKIGRTSFSPLQRLTDLKVGTTEDLYLLGVIRPASKMMEKELHATFNNIRQRGEWFRPEPLLLNYIATNARPWVADPKPDQIEMDSSDLSRRLQRLLDDRGLSISEAARMTGIEKQRCWLVVTGRNDNPTWKTIVRLVEGVGGSMKELFADEGD